MEPPVGSRVRCREDVRAGGVGTSGVGGVGQGVSGGGPTAAVLRRAQVFTARGVKFQTSCRIVTFGKAVYADIPRHMEW
ncbi:hypothetical protein GCM10018781_17660 [Kitasatospora indigofera]|uniref:Uncharacterized protein n=1 Tax=Kitasatospora indigofera TaxID=67307 RepID=A0A919FHA1_9ACTN|nr:hypothetical protein GCM10018781_17660 [Kitasatospora indigofera]